MNTTIYLNFLTAIFSLRLSIYIIMLFFGILYKKIRHFQKFCEIYTFLIAFNGLLRYSKDIGYVLLIDTVSREV